ncbi:MAG: hypothetical protein IPK82_05980 [Polyangiaceae bacterium]|nr:hypothetical protein [Polyangiaceae bacterium]
MSYTFVEFGPREFIASVGILEVWLMFVVETIDSLHDGPAWLNQARSDWAVQATGNFGASLDPHLDDHVQGESSRTLLVQICDKTIENLRAFGDFVPVATLNRLAGKRIFERDIETANVIHTGDFFRRLLSGHLRPEETDAMISWRIKSVER